MQKVNILELSRLTGKDRENIGKWISGLSFEPGKGRAKLYNSEEALSRIYLRRTEKEQADKDAQVGGEYVDQQEANRILAVRRGEQIALEMEVTAKKRIPLDICEEVNDKAFSNVAGMLKAYEGKTLTAESINDMLTELRTVSDALAQWSK